MAASYIAEGSISGFHALSLQENTALEIHLSKHIPSTGKK